MSADRRAFRYPEPDGPHDHRPGNGRGLFCAGCETFAVLRQVEGFHEELDVSAHSRERVEHAVEAAALRGFLMGLDLARRYSIDASRVREIEGAAHGFLS